MNDQEYYTFEDRAYINPTLSRDEQLGLIDTLKFAQDQANAEIRTQTENLGTQVPSVKGGLTGPESYFRNRYQTSRSNAMAADLKAAAQASALNDVLSNYQNQLQKQYNDAYKKYQKNQARRASSGRGGGGGGDTGYYPAADNTITGGLDEIVATEGEANEWLGVDVTGEHAKYPNATLLSTVNTGDYITDANGNRIPIYRKLDQNEKVVETNDPAYAQGADGYWYPRQAGQDAGKNLTGAALGAALGGVGLGPLGAVLGWMSQNGE